MARDSLKLARELIDRIESRMREGAAPKDLREMQRLVHQTLEMVIDAYRIRIWRPEQRLTRRPQRTSPKRGTG